MGQELLNLAARHNLLYRVLDRSFPASQKLDGLPAVLYLDAGSPAAALQAKLMAFVQSGGLLIVPHALAAAFPAGNPCPAWWPATSCGKWARAPSPRPRTNWEDPYFLAADVHNLVRRRNDPVTLFNAGSLWEHYSVAPEGRAALLQLVGFTSQPYQAVSLAVAHPRRVGRPIYDRGGAAHRCWSRNAWRAGWSFICRRFRITPPWNSGREL